MLIALILSTLISVTFYRTLFLNEIGELPLTIQKTFLRVLQEKKFRLVGKNREITSDLRLISATNKDLKELVSNGMFRKDLYYAFILWLLMRRHYENILKMLRKSPNFT